MKKLIIANWKLNPVSQKEAKALFDEVKKGVKNASADVVICPPFLYLPQLTGLALGAQNVFYKENGAFTGEVSASQLKDMGVEYVLIGHSERRKYFSETNETVNKKIKAVLENGLIPVLCVGESEGEDKAMVLTEQITEALTAITRDQMKKMVVAYEPVWAIGTGKNCLPDETMSAIVFIKKIISNLYTRDIADGVKILYGGSVKAENAKSYLQDAGADGLLVGGASLKPEEFIAIVGKAKVGE